MTGSCGNLRRSSRSSGGGKPPVKGITHTNCYESMISLNLI
jgi:hypothetical protein